MRTPPFTIVHPKHGEALCDEDQFAQFAEHGWKKKDAAEAEAKAKAGAEAKAKALDKDGDGKPDKKAK